MVVAAAALVVVLVLVVAAHFGFLDPTWRFMDICRVELGVPQQAHSHNYPASGPKVDLPGDMERRGCHCRVQGLCGVCGSKTQRLGFGSVVFEIPASGEEL